MLNLMQIKTAFITLLLSLTMMGCLTYSLLREPTYTLSGLVLDMVYETDDDFIFLYRDYETSHSNDERGKGIKRLATVSKKILLFDKEAENRDYKIKQYYMKSFKDYSCKKYNFEPPEDAVLIREFKGNLPFEIYSEPHEYNVPDNATMIGTEDYWHRIDTYSRGSLIKNCVRDFLSSHPSRLGTFFAVRAYPDGRFNKSNKMDLCYFDYDYARIVVVPAPDREKYYRWHRYPKKFILLPFSVTLDIMLTPVVVFGILAYRYGDT